MKKQETNNTSAAGGQYQKSKRGDSFTRDMFTWLNQVNADSVSATAFRLTYAIGQFINRGTLEAWPGQPTLAGIIGVTERTVRNAVAELVANGHLEVTPGHGPKNPNRYRWRIKNKNEAGAEMRKPASSFKGVNEETSFLISEPNEEISDTKRGSQLPHKRGSQLPTNHLIEPSEEPSEERVTLDVVSDRKQGRRHQGKDQDEIDAAFEQFWKQVPRRVAKAGASKIFRRIIEKGEATLEELTAGILRYAAEVANREERYVAHPGTWLSQARWADEPSKPAGVTIDSDGNPVRPPPQQQRPPWRQRSNLDLAFRGRR
jgi:hypothetical protein